MANETTARQFIFCALIFGAIITGAFTLISFSVPDDNTNFETYNNTFNRFNDINRTTGQINQQLRDADPEKGVLGILNGLLQASWGSLKLIWNSVDILTNTVLGVSEHFPIPSWFTALLVGIIVTSVAFALIAAFYKWHI